MTENYSLHMETKGAFNRPKHLYEFAPESYKYRKSTSFGYVYNISSDLKYNPKDYSVIKQLQRV